MSRQKPFAALGFGEVMLRLSPLGSERIAQGTGFDKYAGGSELNVMSGIARLGLRTGLVSRLPKSPIGTYIRSQIRAHGVSDDYVLEDAGQSARLGVYYYENGAYPRKPQVIYDRASSSFSSITPADIPADIYGKAGLFHTSGISLGLCGSTRHTALALVRAFKEKGALISFDVNYRAKLWSEEDARAAICEILPLVDVLFVSEETSRRMMGKTGSLRQIQKQYAEEYGTAVVASTVRVVNSPRSHTFSSLLYAAKEDCHFDEAPYENIEVTDRIGSGDAYVAGVLYALLSGLGHAACVSYGNACSALKNTMPGDLLSTDIGEISKIVQEHRAGAASEMDR